MTKNINQLSHIHFICILHTKLNWYPNVPRPCSISSSILTLPKPISLHTCSNRFRYVKMFWWTLKLCLGWVSWILLGPVTLEGFGRLKLCLRLFRRMWLRFGRRYWLHRNITSCGRVTLGVWASPKFITIAKGWFPTHQCTGVMLTFWDSKTYVFSCYWTVSYPFLSEHSLV